jgi:DnaJ family protein C protein 13
VGAEETPLGEWSVVRLRSAGKGTVSTVGSVAGTIAPRQAGSGGSDLAVLRQLVLTRTSLVERRPDNYEVSLCA